MRKANCAKEWDSEIGAWTYAKTISGWFEKDEEINGERSSWRPQPARAPAEQAPLQTRQPATPELASTQRQSPLDVTPTPAGQPAPPVVTPTHADQPPAHEVASTQRESPLAETPTPGESPPALVSTGPQSPPDETTASADQSQPALVSTQSPVAKTGDIGIERKAKRKRKRNTEENIETDHKDSSDSSDSQEDSSSEGKVVKKKKKLSPKERKKLRKSQKQIRVRKAMAKKNKLNAKKVVDMTAPLIVSLKNAVNNRLTEVVKPRVPQYMVDECGGVIQILDKVHAFWTEVLNDGYDQEVPEELSYETVCTGAAAWKSMASSLNTMIDIAEATPTPKKTGQ